MHPHPNYRPRDAGRTQTTSAMGFSKWPVVGQVAAVIGLAILCIGLLIAFLALSSSSSAAATIGEASTEIDDAQGSLPTASLPTAAQ